MSEDRSRSGHRGIGLVLAMLMVTVAACSSDRLGPEAATPIIDTDLVVSDPVEADTEEAQSSELSDQAAPAPLEVETGEAIGSATTNSSATTVAAADQETTATLTATTTAPAETTAPPTTTASATVPPLSLIHI